MTTPPTSLDWTDRAAVANYLTGLVPDLVCRVRDDDPDFTGAWIARRVPADQMPALAIVLAAHIPTDRPQADLLAWTLPPDNPARWRKGHRRFVALRSRGVPISAIPRDVAEAERRYQAASYAARAEQDNDRSAS